MNSADGAGALGGGPWAVIGCGTAARKGEEWNWRAALRRTVEESCGSAARIVAMLEILEEDKG